jgi:hypothetical protein
MRFGSLKNLSVTMMLVVLVCLAVPAFSAPTVYLQEGFENSGNIPTGWSMEYKTGTTDWTFQSGGHLGHPASAYTGSYNALLYSSFAEETYLISLPMDLSSLASGSLELYHAQKEWWAPAQDELGLFYRVASGSWVELHSFWTNDLPSWTQETMALPAGMLQDDVQIGFAGKTDYGYGVCLDDITVSGTPVPEPTSMALMTLAAGALCARRRKKRLKTE